MTPNEAMALVLKSISGTTGAAISDLCPAVEAVAKELEAMSRTKYKPRPPWFSLVCEQLAKALREGVEVKT